MLHLRRRILITTFVALLCGCGGTKVLVPPLIDLREYEVLGVIDFESSSKGPLAGLTTSRFIAAARADQGVVRIVELGTEVELLRAVGAERLDRDAIRAIGKKYGVATVLTGKLEVSKVTPAVSVGPGLDALGIVAEVEASLEAEMIETSTGASLWGKSATRTHRVGGITLFGGKSVSFDARDPERAYGEMVRDLVDAVTGDFQARWERRDD